MFNKLKNKLKNWLFKEEQEKIEECLSKLRKIDYQMSDFFVRTETCISLANSLDVASKKLLLAETMCDIAKNDINECIEATNQLREVVTPLLGVGIDIGFGEDHSWAVVCVKGKPEYVKFISLEGRDTREIMDFLRRYQQSNRVIDSPMAYKHFFKQGVLI